MTDHITFRAKLRTVEDENILFTLANYCKRMKLNMGTTQVNDDIIVEIIGREDNMQEIREHLERLAND